MGQTGPVAAMFDVDAVGDGAAGDSAGVVFVVLPLEDGSGVVALVLPVGDEEVAADGALDGRHRAGAAVDIVVRAELAGAGCASSDPQAQDGGCKDHQGEAAS